MAFPTSSTFVAANVLTAAQLNALRADLLATNGYVLKTADESVTSSAVLQNDDHLFYTIGATGTYLVDVYAFITSAANAAGDFNGGFSFPTGTMHFGVQALDPSLASAATGSMFAGATLSATSGTTAQFAGASTGTTLAWYHGILTATATGTLRFMWAQGGSHASATTLKSGSHMTVRQVA